MTAAFPPPSLAAQVAELKREKIMRARVYPILVSQGKLKQMAADRQNQCLDAAIATLERLAANSGDVTGSSVAPSKEM